MRARFIASLFLPAALWCQEEVVSALDRLARDPADKDAVRVLSGTYDPRVIEAFKTAFDTTTDPEIESDVAFDLVDDGIKDAKYFDYLADGARAGLEDDAPRVLALDADGNEIKGRADPEFEKWCKDHNRELSACLGDHMYILPAAVIKLAMLGDDRATDLLLKGLRSGNPVVVVACIRGLGALGKTRALPTIAELMGAGPPSVAFAYASALVEFGGPTANALIDKYVKDENLRATLKSGAGGGFKILLDRRRQRGIIQ